MDDQKDFVIDTLNASLAGLANAVLNDTVGIIEDGEGNKVGVQWPSEDGTCVDSYSLDKDA